MPTQPTRFRKKPVEIQAVQLTDDADRAHAAEVRAAALPAWEAVYEPGNVSDYVIGYAGTEVAAKGAAVAWLRSQRDYDRPQVWQPDPQLAVGEYDVWFELSEDDGDGTPTGPGLIVRRRAARSDDTTGGAA